MLDPMRPKTLRPTTTIESFRRYGSREWLPTTSGLAGVPGDRPASDLGI